jgi:hypothetical protein
MNWQPIETAPKNDVIVLCNGGTLWQGFWQEGFGWVTGYDDGVMYVRIVLKPTYWSPLPSPPVIDHNSAPDAP